ncbi:MAG: hypothetical protein NVS4B12_19830 [Ktedonobacteraceae bacterium]
MSIYKDKSFSTSQSQFEKDLKKRQREGWRLVSITPTKKRGFGRIVQLTAIYEKDVLDSSGTSAATSVQAKAIEATRRAENKAQARTERREKFKEAQRRAREQEQAYRNSLSPEQLQQYLKHKRRRNFIVATVVLVAIVLCIAVSANNPALQTSSNALPTSVPIDTPTPVPTKAAQPTAKPTSKPTAVPTVKPTETLAQQEAAYKAGTTNFTVSDLDKQGNAEQGQDVHFAGRILNFVKDSSGTTAGANVDDPTSATSSVVQIVLPLGADLTQLNQGDTIEVWGTDEGVVSGTNAFGATIQEVQITTQYMTDQTTNYSL